MLHLDRLASLVPFGYEQASLQAPVVIPLATRWGEAEGAKASGTSVIHQRRKRLASRDSSRLAPPCGRTHPPNSSKSSTSSSYSQLTSARPPNTWHGRGHNERHDVKHETGRKSPDQPEVQRRGFVEDERRCSTRIPRRPCPFKSANPGCDVAVSMKAVFDRLLKVELTSHL